MVSTQIRKTVSTSSNSRIVQEAVYLSVPELFFARHLIILRNALDHVRNATRSEIDE
jgi:hypothetical protein